MPWSFDVVMKYWTLHRLGFVRTHSHTLPPPPPVWFGFLRKGPLPTFYWTLLNITRHNAQQYSSDTALRRHKPNTDKNLGNIAIEHIWCLFSASLLSYKLENVFNKRGMSLLWTSLEVSFCLLSLLNLSWRLLILKPFLLFWGGQVVIPVEKSENTRLRGIQQNPMTQVIIIFSSFNRSS